MKKNETWENRPNINTGEISSILNLYKDSLPVINDICNRREHLLETNGVLNLTDTSPEYKDVYDRAADIIINAIRNDHYILISGDYDVDGMTATATLCACLHVAYKISMDHVRWWIPTRDDGYGVNADKITAYIKSLGWTDKNILIITVDNGIAAKDEIAKLTAQSNIKVLVTDHHLAEGKELPECEYILNPKVFAKEDSDEYMASGCYVAAKLGLIVVKTIYSSPEYSLPTVKVIYDTVRYNLTTYCEVLTGLSILSDVIPLNVTMRGALSLAMIGLTVLEHAGLKALLTLCNYNEGNDITTNFLSFIVIPKLNSAGRMNRVDVGMKLLLLFGRKDLITGESISDRDALLTANELINLNRDRKIIEDAMLTEAYFLIEKHYNIKENMPPAIVVHSSEWLAGIVGIVAARLAEAFQVPTICLAGTDVLHGSGRAPQGYDLYNGLAYCKDVITEFGGHRVAGGVSLTKDKLDEFRTKFSEFYKSENEHKIVRYIDGTATIDQLKNVKFQMFLKTVEPFGNLNEPLSILLENVTVLSSFKRTESQYYIVAEKSGNNIVIGKFRPEPEWSALQPGCLVDFLVTPNLTYFTGLTVPEYRGISFRLRRDEALNNMKVFTNEKDYLDAVNKK